MARPQEAHTLPYTSTAAAFGHRRYTQGENNDLQDFMQALHG